MSLDFSPKSYTPDGVAVFASDDQLLVRFFNHPTISKFKSDEAGMPVYDDVTMISVIQPGEKEETKVLANEWHKRRFHRQFEAFQKGIEHVGSGTPLDHLFPSEPGMVMTLKSFNVFTVQQLAAVNDTVIGNLPMGRTLVDRAKTYLATAAGGSEYHHMLRRMEAMEAEKETMRAEIAALREPARRGPGRPKETDHVAG